MFELQFLYEIVVCQCDCIRVIKVNFSVENFKTNGIGRLDFSQNLWCDIMWSELNAILRFDFCAVLCCCSWLSGHQKSKVRNKKKELRWKLH